MDEVVPMKRFKNDVNIDECSLVDGQLFPNSGPNTSSNLWPPNSLCMAESFLSLERRQCAELDAIRFAQPVSYVYDPLRYAAEPHERFVRRYCLGPKQCLFLGMNPGPFGMAQTGVPFGQVSLVKEWLGIEGVVGKPRHEHPRRPILGFKCQRGEVSGQRFWGLFRDICETPAAFFQDCFVHNYCPLLFTTETGKNVTPPSIAIAERRELQGICDVYLREAVALLQAKIVIAIGKYTYERARSALKQQSVDDVSVEFIMHPSPINPKANKGWNGIVKKRFEELNVMQYLVHEM